MSETITHCRMCQTRFGPGRWDAKRSSVYSHVCTSCYHNLPASEPTLSPPTSAGPSHVSPLGPVEASTFQPDETKPPSYSSLVGEAPGGNQIT